MIVYVVPYLHKYGGIQSFSTQVRKKLKNNHHIELLDWSFSYLGIILKKIFNFSPQLYRAFLRLRLSQEQKLLLERAKLIHFWHPLAAIGFEQKRFIVSCHGREILPANLEDCDRKALEKVFRSAQMIHVDSRFTRKILLKTFPLVSNRKIKIIYPGLVSSSKTPARRKVKKGKKIIIGTLSRFNPRKNIPAIIDALEILQNKYQLEFQYLLAGRGMEQGLILSKLRRAKFPWQYFPDLSDVRKMSVFYTQLDIFVLPTLSLPDDVEGFGIVYLEANQFGIPVVASRVDGCQEAVKEGVSGIFVNPQNPQAIARAIYELVAARKNYAQSARKWAQAFRLDHTALEFQELYEQCLRET